MAAAGNVVVSLIARTEAFTRGMNNSRRSLRALEKTTMATMRTVKRLGVVAAGAAIGGLAVLTKNSLETIDATAKLSDRLGVSTEFLTAYGHAAKIAGTSSEEFQKSMEIFVRRIGELTQGTGEAKQGLEAIGLKLEDIINLNPEQSFLMIADKIKGMGTQAEKAATAYRLFGRAGSKMLNLIEGDLDGVIEKAEALGITFDRDMAAKVEAANDAIARMNAAFGGLGNTLAIAVAPILEVIANRITEIAVGQNSVQAIQERIQKAAIAVSFLSDAFLIAKGVVLSIVGIGQEIARVFTHMATVLTAIFSVIAKGLRLQGVERSVDKITAELTALTKDFGKSADANFGNALESFFDVGKSREAMKKFFKEVEKTRSDVGKRAIPSYVADIVEKTEKIKAEPDAKAFDAGRFEQVRTDLIDVAGLSSDANNPMLSSAKLNTDQNQKIIEELEKLNQKETLI